MASVVTIPIADEIAKRICECRAELSALKRLHRLAMTARQAEEARHRGQMLQAGQAGDSEARRA
jgi:hypothetical protein